MARANGSRNWVRWGLWIITRTPRVWFQVRYRHGESFALGACGWSLIWVSPVIAGPASLKSAQEVK